MCWGGRGETKEVVVDEGGGGYALWERERERERVLREMNAGGECALD